MSFFISKELEGRVTEKELISPENEVVISRNLDKKFMKFKFIRYDLKESILILEPHTGNNFFDFLHMSNNETYYSIIVFGNKILNKKLNLEDVTYEENKIIITLSLDN